MMEYKGYIGTVESAIPKVGPQTANAPAVSCDIGGRAGPLESGRTESPGNGSTNNAFGHGNSKCVCTFGIAAVEYDDKARIFHGEIINTRDVITFQGRSVEELESSFRESIEDYLTWCEEDGVSPEKPNSGRFNLRRSPQLHRELAIVAEKRDLSINTFVERAIKDEIKEVES